MSRPASSKPASATFIDGSVGRTRLVPWLCGRCGERNDGTRKVCVSCSNPSFDPAPLALAVTVPSHPEFSRSPLLLTELKYTTTIGFLRDLLESKTGMKDSSMIRQANTKASRARLVSLLQPQTSQLLPCLLAFASCLFSFSSPVQGLRRPRLK